MKDTSSLLLGFEFSNKLQPRPPRPRLSHSPAFRQATTRSDNHQDRGVRQKIEKWPTTARRRDSPQTEHDFTDDIHAERDDADQSDFANQKLYDRLSCLSMLANDKSRFSVNATGMDYCESKLGSISSAENPMGLANQCNLQTPPSNNLSYERAGINDQAPSSECKPTQDILAQWRLRRRMEEARKVTRAASCLSNVSQQLRENNLNGIFASSDGDQSMTALLMPPYSLDSLRTACCHPIPGGPEKRQFGVQSDLPATYTESTQTEKPLDSLATDRRDVAVLTEPLATQRIEKPSQRSVRTMITKRYRDATFQFPDKPLSGVNVPTSDSGLASVMDRESPANENCNCSHLTETDSWQWSPSSSPPPPRFGCHRGSPSRCPDHSCCLPNKPSATANQRNSGGQRVEWAIQENESDTHANRGCTYPSNGPYFKIPCGTEVTDDVTTLSFESAHLQPAAGNVASHKKITDYMEAISKNDFVETGLPIAYSSDPMVQELCNRRRECLRNLRSVITQIHARELQAIQSAERI